MTTILGHRFDEIKLAAGQITGAKVVHKFGSNPSVGTTIEDVWQTGGSYTWLQSPVSLEAISDAGGAQDNISGTGARKIIVQGLDSNFDEVEEEIEMNGTSATTATTQTFLRVHRAYISECGAYQSTTNTITQAGAITIRTASAGATHITLAESGGTGMGQSEVLRYTIPRGYTAFLTGVHLTASSAKPVKCYLFQRINADNTSSNLRPKRLVWRVVGLQDHVSYVPIIPHKFNEKTDIWISAVVDTTSANIEGDFELVLIPNAVVAQW